MGRSRVLRLRRLLPLFLLASVAAAAEAPTEAVWDLRCETRRLDLDDPETAWTRIAGLDAGAPADAASLLLLLRPGGERRLEVVARGGGTLAARLNDIDLGERPLARGWGALAWSLPAAAVRPGVNVLRLERRGEARGRRRYGLRLVRVDPAVACGRGASGGVLGEPRRPLALAPGQLLIVRRGWSAPARLDLDVRTRWPGAAVAVDCFTARAGHRALELAGGRRLTAVERHPLDGACAAAEGLAVAALGPDEARVGAARVVPRPALSWRRRIALVAALLTALVAAALLLAARRAARSAPAAASGRPWRDAAVVVAVAAAARLVFLAFYPYPGHADDSWEYLMRARLLADGSAAFWSDTSWHAWQTFSRPPGYFAFLAAAVGDRDGGPALALALQLLFSAAAAGATFLAARPLFGRRAALAAGLLFALYLPSITTFSTLMSEPLYMLFMVPALAAVAWTATAPRRSTAIAAGALFGLAALVRSGPLVLAPITAAPLVAALGWRRGLRAAGWLLGAAVLTVLPWVVRNSILAGELAGVDDIAVANLLQTHPDPRFVPTDGVDLETEEGFQTYYWRIKAGNADRSLSRQQGAILRSVVARLARHPGATARRFWSNFTALLAPRPDEDLRWILGDHHRVRLAWINSFLAAQYLLVLAAGAAGLVLAARRRAAWPLAAWLLASLLIVNLIFYYEPRFRLQVMPCLMVFAGAALARLVGGPRPAGVGDPGAAGAQAVVQKTESVSITTPPP